MRTGWKVTSVGPLERKGAAPLHLAGNEIVEADRVLVAVGRRAATEGLGLDRAGVETERGFIVTDDFLATTANGIWAVGDVVGKLQFTHVANEMGRIAAAGRGGEVIAEAALASAPGCSPPAWPRTAHAYPNWSTALWQAAARSFIEVDGRRALPATADRGRY